MWRALYDRHTLSNAAHHQCLLPAFQHCLSAVNHGQAEPNLDVGHVNWTTTADDVYLNTRFFNLLYTSEVLSFNGPKAPGGKVPSRVFANGGNYSDQGLFWPVGRETLTVLHPLFPDVIVVPDIYYNQSAYVLHSTFMPLCLCLRVWMGGWPVDCLLISPAVSHFLHLGSLHPGALSFTRTPSAHRCVACICVCACARAFVSPWTDLRV